jgi:hypothetical protein
MISLLSFETTCSRTTKLGPHAVPVMYATPCLTSPHGTKSIEPNPSSLFSHIRHTCSTCSFRELGQCARQSEGFPRPFRHVMSPERQLLRQRMGYIFKNTYMIIISVQKRQQVIASSEPCNTFEVKSALATINYLGSIV